jgi:uncharacterized damage-inducible protein DinB
LERGVSGHSEEAKMTEPLSPFLTANLAVLDELFADLLALVQHHDDAALNWTPLPGEANSIAAMVTHVAGSLDNWLARAVGEAISRDRDAEFRARASAEDLAALVSAALERAHQRFALLEGIDPATIRRVRRLSSNEIADVSIAWCVEHAISHTGEHWGQVQLTSQLVGRARSQPDI